MVCSKNYISSVECPPLHRQNRIVREIMEMGNLRDLDVLTLKRMYRWVGHAAREADRHLERLVSLILNWREDRQMETCPL